jgi:hypothetical protein
VLPVDPGLLKTHAAFFIPEYKYIILFVIKNEVIREGEV